MANNVKDSLQNAELRRRSGKVDNTDPLVGFLYTLMRDHLTAGKVESLVRDSVPMGSKVQFTNGWLAEYAQDAAARLRER